jgi:hypothetical protein
MPQLRLLYLDAECLTALRWQKDTLHAESRFPHDEVGLANFAEYLAQHRGSNYRLLADIADESFQIEMLPYTQGADRSALLTRKLGQYFYGAPLSAAISYGREKSGRRDEKFMFTALTRPQLFEPWLVALRAAEAQLAGIWALPLLGATLLAKLPNARESCLFVAITRTGIRQSFFENDQLVFSRLTPLATADIAETADRCVAEVAKIQQYLLGQRLLARGKPLQVVVLVHPAQTGVFMDRCKNLDDIQVGFQDLHAAAKAIGLKSLPQDSYSEALFLHLLAQNPPPDQFAPAPERRFHRLWQIRSWLVRGGAVALLGCLLYSGHEMVNVFKARTEADALRQQAEADAQRYHAIQATFPPMPASTENLRAVINRFEAMEKGSAPPEFLYFAISRALEETPRIDIERIQWQLSGSPNDALKLKPAGPGAPAAPAAGGMHDIAVVHGLLPASMAADQRGQLETVNAFADALRKTPGLQVAVERMPFDIESGKSLKSSGDAGQSTAELKFVIHLSRKL